MPPPPPLLYVAQNNSRQPSMSMTSQWNMGHELDKFTASFKTFHVKTLFIIPTDAHYYKSVEMLKQFKSYNICPDMFRFMQEPSSGSSPVLG
jgi:hypothetical protein